MNIWLISAFEPTPIDNTRPMRFMGIAEAALKKGHRVTFFSSTFKHSNKQQRYDRTTSHVVEENKYELVFVHSRPYQKNISVSRMLSHGDLAEKLMLEIKNKPKPDVIFISLPPLSTVNKICDWGKKNGVPVIVDIIDIWPDVFLKAIPSSIRSFAKVPLFSLYRKLKNIFKNCSGVTSISEQYIAWTKKFGLTEKPTAFFYPAVQFNEVKTAFEKLEGKVRKNEGKLRIIYAGSLSSSYDIPTILDAAELLEQKYPGKTEFAIGGAGPQENIIKERNLRNVKFLGWLGQEDIYREFYLSHLGLTQHVNGATQSVTYKLFDYLSAGLPILNSLDSEMADIIEDNKVGFNNKSGDVLSLVSNIEKFIDNRELLHQYKKNALQLTSTLGDSEKVYSNLVQFIESFKN